MTVEKLIARARGRKFLHIGLMLFWTVLALFTSAWFLILTAIHWALASLYEQLDPVLAQRLRARRERYAQDRMAVYDSRRVIERLKNEAYLKRHPWVAAVVASVLSPYLAWRGIFGSTTKLDLKGYTEGHARGADLSKGIFGPR